MARMVKKKAGLLGSLIKFQLIAIIIGLVLSFIILFGIAALSYLVPIAVVYIYIAVLYGYVGRIAEREITYDETMTAHYEQKEMGSLPDSERKYSMKNLYKALMITALPFIFIGLVCSVGYLVSGPEAKSIFKVIGRIVSLPFISVLMILDSGYLNLDIMPFVLPVLTFIYPVTAYLAYKSGPEQHARLKKIIARHKRRVTPGMQKKKTPGSGGASN